MVVVNAAFKFPESTKIIIDGQNSQMTKEKQLDVHSSSNRVNGVKDMGTQMKLVLISPTMTVDTDGTHPVTCL